MKKYLTFLTPFLAIMPLLSADITCNTPKEKLEQKICSSDALKKLYIQVSGRYETLKTTPNYFYFINELREEQQQWKKMTKSRCLNLVDSKQESCLSDAYQKRLSALKELESRAMKNVAVYENGSCNDVAIITKIVVDNSKDICSKYTYLDNNSRIKLSNSVLSKEAEITSEDAILAVVDYKNVIAEDHCDAYSNQEVFEESVVYINPNVVSLKYFGWEYRGGAHGNGDNYYINYDRNDGSIVTWETLFKNNTAFVNYLKKRVKKELMVKNYLDKKDQEAALNAFKNLGYFSIRSNGLYIEYGAYEIAPYASGYPSLLVNKQTLKKYMSKKIYRRYFVNDGSVYLNTECKKI